MKKQLITALSITLLTATGGTAMGAQPGAHDGRPGAHDGDRRHDRKLRFHRGGGHHDAFNPQMMLRHLGKKLELDTTQQQKIDNILSAAKPQLDELRKRAEVNRRAMHELDASDSNHDAKLNSLAAEQGSIVSEQAMLHGRLKADIHAVLTPEQRQELAEKSKKMRERFRSGRAAGSTG